jgi:hypothetical protein
MHATRPPSFSRFVIALAVALGMLLGAGVVAPRDAPHGAHTHECPAGDADHDPADACDATKDEGPSRAPHGHVHALDDSHDGTGGSWTATARVAYVDSRRPDTGSGLIKRDASDRLDRPPREIFAV